MNNEYFGALLVLAGDPPRGLARDKLLELANASPRPQIIAADGGAAYLAELGIRPDLIIGDCDSIPAELFSDIPRQLFPAAKNFTDGEAAYAYTVENSQGKIALFGALGGRLDHFLTNIYLPLQWYEQAKRFVLFGDDFEAFYSLGHLEVVGNPGDTLSIIAVSAQVKGITLKNLVYGLENYDLERGSSRCVSNVLAEPVAIIEHKEGLALVIHYPAVQEKLE